jgi:lipopolysaccharide export system ATP-binding protein
VVLDAHPFSVEPGQIVGLLGPNGAGKTTLFRILMGVLLPDRGQVWLGPREITRLPTYLRARAGMGYLPQEPSVFSGLDVHQHLLLVRQLRGGEPPASDALVEAFGLGDKLHTQAALLSGGEQRRLEIVRFLATRPRVALLDEPFRGLDLAASDALVAALERLARQGAAILLSDHHVQQALTICHKMTILVSGRIAYSGDAETAAEHLRRLAAPTGRSQDRRAESGTWPSS